MNEAAVVTLARLVVGLLFSSLIGWLAYRRNSLTISGVFGAMFTGTLIFGLGGIVSGLELVVFFVTSSALSHYKAARKQAVVEHFDKGSQRDLGQALANGGVASFCAICSGLAWLANGSPSFITLCFGALLGALASANADTWATELGVLSKTRPRLITHFTQVVEPGASGGVTRDGTLAAAASALVIGLVNMLCLLVAKATGAERNVWLILYNAQASTPANLALVLVMAALVGGMAGALADSYMGATVQAIYFSAQRNKITERRCERDGTANRLIKGWRWLNNDWVNFLASLVGATVAGAVLFVAAPR